MLDVLIRKYTAISKLKKKNPSGKPNCGTGWGGFKIGNVCARGRRGRQSTGDTPEARELSRVKIREKTRQAGEAGLPGMKGRRAKSIAPLKSPSGKLVHQMSYNDFLRENVNNPRYAYTAGGIKKMHATKAFVDWYRANKRAAALGREVPEENLANIANPPPMPQGIPLSKVKEFTGKAPGGAKGGAGPKAEIRKAKALTAETLAPPVAPRGKQAASAVAVPMLTPATVGKKLPKQPIRKQSKTPQTAEKPAKQPIRKQPKAPATSQAGAPAALSSEAEFAALSPEEQYAKLPNDKESLKKISEDLRKESFGLEFGIESLHSKDSVGDLRKMDALRPRLEAVENKMRGVSVGFLGMKKNFQKIFGRSPDRDVRFKNVKTGQEFNFDNMTGEFNGQTPHIKMHRYEPGSRSNIPEYKNINPSNVGDWEVMTGMSDSKPLTGLFPKSLAGANPVAPYMTTPNYGTVPSGKQPASPVAAQKPAAPIQQANEATEAERARLFNPPVKLQPPPRVNSPAEQVKFMAEREAREAEHGPWNPPRGFIPHQLLGYEPKAGDTEAMKRRRATSQNIAETKTAEASKGTVLPTSSGQQVKKSSGQVRRIPRPAPASPQANLVKRAAASYENSKTWADRMRNESRGTEEDHQKILKADQSVKAAHQMLTRAQQAKPATPSTAGAAPRAEKPKAFVPTPKGGGGIPDDLSPRALEGHNLKSSLAAVAADYNKAAANPRAYPPGFLQDKQKRIRELKQQIDDMESGKYSERLRANIVRQRGQLIESFNTAKRQAIHTKNKKLYDQVMRYEENFRQIDSAYGGVN